MSTAGKIADDAADRAAEEYGQRLDALDLAVRVVERWPPVGVETAWEDRADDVKLIAEHFRAYLNGSEEDDGE